MSHFRADATSGTVASDEVARANDLRFILAVEAPKRRDDGVFGIVGPRDRHQFAIIVRCQPPWSVPHHLKIEIMNPGLAEYDMGHLGQVILNVLDTIGPDDPGLVFPRPPKCNLVDPVGLFDDFFSEPEGFEHFDRSAGNPVSLANLEWSGLAFRDANGDFRKPRKLCGKRQPGWAASDDKNVHRCWRLRITHDRPCNRRISLAETFKMELHQRPRSPSRNA